MRIMNDKIIREAQTFTARWGFLTRGLFFEFFCVMSQAQQYRYWDYLVSSGLFCESKANPQVLLLTYKTRALFGDAARPSRLPAYVEHDALIARVFISLNQRGLIAKSWLEDELIRNPLEAYTVLGSDRTPRIPDLVFDLKTLAGTQIRCALEIERTVKSQSRYAKMALSYLGYSKLNMILFGCGNASTEAAVRKAFSGAAFAAGKRIPGVFLYEEFDPENLQTPIRFQDRQFSIQNFLEIITKLKIQKPDSIRERNENRFSFRNPKKGEAA